MSYLPYTTVLTPNQSSRCLFPRPSGSEPPLRRRQALQLHPSQLLRQPAGGAEDHQRRLLPPLPAGQAVWRQLWLRNRQLEHRLHLPGLQDDAQATRGASQRGWLVLCERKRERHRWSKKTKQNSCQIISPLGSVWANISCNIEVTDQYTQYTAIL